MSNTKILIVAPAWVGDLVMSLTLLNALKEINKDVTIDLLVMRIFMTLLNVYLMFLNLLSLRQGMVNYHSFIELS